MRAARRLAVVVLALVLGVVMAGVGSIGWITGRALRQINGMLVP